MNISGSINEVRQIVKKWRKEGLTVGLVPTMGYLHEGHKSASRSPDRNLKSLCADMR